MILLAPCLPAALGSLQQIGALDVAPSLALTPLGQHLTRMPCDPRIGKVSVWDGGGVHPGGVEEVIYVGHRVGSTAGWLGARGRKWQGVVPWGHGLGEMLCEAWANTKIATPVSTAGCN